MSMENKFQVGDRVRFGKVGKPMISGVISDYARDNHFWVITLEGKFRVPEEALTHDTDTATHDPKTAFLTELKGLLEKYDAKIGAYPAGWDGEIDICFSVGDEEVMYSDENPIFKGSDVCEITADNLMDYDKE